MCIAAYSICKSLLDIRSVFSWKISWCHGDVNCLVYRQLSANFKVVTTILFAHTTFLWATCCLIYFIPIFKTFLIHWSWLVVVPFIERGNMTHSGCNRSTGDDFSSVAPDPTSDIFRGPCTSIFWFVFPVRLMRLITDRYFCHFLYVYCIYPYDSVIHGYCIFNFVYLQYICMLVPMTQVVKSS
jgi:hypothetical protein